jgi:hypothetical protein
MANQNGKLRQVDWNGLLPWLIMIRSVRVALMARVLILGALGLIVMGLGWWVIGLVFSGSADPVIGRWHDASARWVWQESPGFAIPMSVDNADELFSSAASGLIEAPVSLWLYMTRPFVDLFRADLTWVGFIFLLLCGIWELLVWGLAGGAITRIAALRLTRNEAPDLVAATAHAGKRWLSYSLAPLIALGGSAVFAVQLVILGFIMRLSLLAAIAGILWPFVLMLGLLMAILLLGALVGWPLMWATVSVEGTDAFDALSRGYAYTYQRPLRLLWYVVFAAILAAMSMFVVKLFAASAIALGDWSISWGLDDETMHGVVNLPEGLPGTTLPPPVFRSTAPPGIVPSPSLSTDAGQPVAEGPGMFLRTARGAIYFWKSLMAALAAGYQAGFLWVAAVAIYLLLRRDIDGAEMDEVYIDQQDEYGMPALSEEGSFGVPEVNPNDKAQPGDAGKEGGAESGRTELQS